MVDESGSLLPPRLDDTVDRLLARSLRAPRVEAGARARMLARLTQAIPRRRRPWLPWLLVPALAALGVTLLAVLSPSSVGVVSSAEMGCERLRQARTEAATAGMVLRPGDIVRTAAGRAAVSLERRAVVTLEPNTRLEIGTAPVAAGIASGRARFQVAPASERFHVRTPGGTVIVVGTIFEISVLGRAPSVRVLVRLVEGSLRLESPAGHLAIGAGESAVLAPEAAPRRLEQMRAPENAVVAAALVDCTRAGGADCDDIARAVETLQAMEDQISAAERRALAESTSRAQALQLAALRRLYTEVLGVEPSAGDSYGALVEEIEATLPPEELREAHSRPTGGSTSTSAASRFVRLVGDTNEAIRTELARLVPLHRVAPILWSRAIKNEGGKP
jgi:FecR protein